MPVLPVSSQTYMPNPLVGPKAAEAGFDIGKQSSPFANFVGGAFAGAKDTLNLIDVGQQIAERPQKLAQEQERVDVLKDEIGLRQQQEDRMGEQQSLNENYRWAEFDARRDDARYRHDLLSAQAMNLRTSAAIRSQNQAQQNAVDGAIMGMVADGDPSGLLGLASDKQNPHTFGLALHALTSDPSLGFPAASKLKEAIDSGHYSQEENQRMMAMLQAVNNGKNMVSAYKDANGAPETIAGILGARPRDGAGIIMEPLSDPTTGNRIPGAFKVYDHIPGEKTKVVLTERYDATLDQKQATELWKAKSALDRVISVRQSATQRVTENAVSQVAAGKAQQATSLSQQQELPARTSASRVGTAGIGRAETPEQTAARLRLQSLTGRSAPSADAGTNVGTRMGQLFSG